MTDRESEKEGRKFLSMTKFIEKTEDKVQVASTETKIIESVDFFLGIENVGFKLRDIEIDKEEFDPGSG